MKWETKLEEEEDKINEEGGGKGRGGVGGVGAGGRCLEREKG